MFKDARKSRKTAKAVKAAKDAYNNQDLNKEPPKPSEMPKFDYQGGRLFHGTSRDIEGAILPTAAHGKRRLNTPTEGPEKGDTEWRTPERLAYDAWLRHNKAYSTGSEDYAWHTFAHRTADLHPERKQRGRVYEVKPNATMDVGAFNHEYTADRFDIAERHDIKPGHQGTFPEIDWREHGSDRVKNLLPKDISQDQYFNHPSPRNQEGARKRAEAEEAPEVIDRPHEEVPGQQALWGEHVPAPSLSGHQFRLVEGGGV